MRIVAGRLGGLQFASPRTSKTHPMSDKVRGALYNTLGDIEGLTVFDAFAGSGALGFEALSRGASSVLLTENDRPAQRTISQNIQNLTLATQAKLVTASCSTWMSGNPETRFDLVLADPPFDDLQHDTLHKLIRHVLPEGLFVLNWPGKAQLPKFVDIDIVEHKTYGDTQLLFYRHGASS